MKILKHLKNKKDCNDIGHMDAVAACSTATFLCDCSNGGSVKGPDVSRALKGVAAGRHMQASGQYGDTCSIQ